MTGVWLWLTKKGAQLWAILLAIGAAVAVVFGFLHNAKKAGILQERERNKDEELKRVDREAVRKVEQAQAQSETEVETVKAAKDEASKVNQLGDGDAADKLRDEWARD